MILRTLLHTARQYKLFPPNSVIVLAISGGADSLAMLHALLQLNHVFACEWHVATLDHGLRGVAGQADAAFVAQISAEWGIRCTTGKMEVPKLAGEWQIGMEVAARRARYQFLADVANKIGAKTIATAHHKDDQAETILMRLLRGAGSDGLSGIKYQTQVPEHPELTLIRPLLDTSRAEIEAYCHDNDLQPRHDATNQDRLYFRNKVRLDIMPQLRHLNFSLNDLLIQTADIIQTEHEFILDYYEKHIVPQLIVAPQRWSISRATFQRVHSAIQREMIRQAGQSFGLELSYAHITASVNLGATGKVGATINLPDDYRVRLSYDSIYIEASKLPLPDDNYYKMDGQIPVKIPGKTVVNDWILHAFLDESEDNNMTLAITEDAEVYLRTRQAGDRFQPLGMNGQSQKLKKWFIDHKVPRHLRDSIPLLIVNGKVAAIILSDYWFVADLFAISKVSQRKIHFSIRKLL